MRNKLLRGVLVGLAALAAAGFLDSLHVFRPLEWKTWDARMRLFADPARASKDIVLVLVDEYSLDIYKKEQSLAWPWPREIYAYLIRYLKSGGAAACYFDFALSDDSIRGISDDQALARAAADAGNVFFVIALSTEEKESDETAVAGLKRFSLSPSAPARSTEIFRSITAPLPVFLPGAKGVANVRVIPDGDGIYRRMPLSFTFRDMILPSVPLALAQAVAGPALPAFVPTDRDGQMIVRFWGRTGASYRTYPIAALLNSMAQIQESKTPQVPPAEFAGKTVLVGLSAVGLFDLKSSPMSGVVPGVEIQAAALDTLLHKSYFTSVAPAATLALALLFAVGAGIAVSRLRKTVFVVAAFALFLALPAAAACAAFAGGSWLDFIFPEVGVLFALIGASVLNYSIEGKERRFIKGVFSHYLSPAVIERLIADPKLVQLGGAEREITSFFSDVAGFTSISEHLAPADLVHLLNCYLSEMTDIILDSGGTLDKYEGDAIVAFWNAPLDVPGHALRACRAALACGRRLVEIGPDLEKRFGHRLRMRIGLNTGSAVVGNMGSGRRFDYTAMGDTVNLAARLESAGKQYGVSLLAGEATVAAAGEEILSRDADLIRVVGKARPVRIYELLGERATASAADLERRRLYHEALALFRERAWERALEAFVALGPDSLAQIYVERCREFLRSAPPGDWDGVFDLKSK
jgi:adenylate cyclase